MYAHAVGGTQKPSTSPRKISLTYRVSNFPLKYPLQCVSSWISRGLLRIVSLQLAVRPFNHFDSTYIDTFIVNVTTKSSHRLPECREPSSACPSSGFHLSRVIRSPPRSRSRSPDLRAPTEHSRQHPNASLRCRRNYQTRNPGTCQGITNSTSHRTTCHCGRVACVPLVTEPSRQYPSPPLRHKGSKATTETVDTRQPPLTTLADYQVCRLPILILFFTSPSAVRHFLLPSVGRSCHLSTPS